MAEGWKRFQGPGQQWATHGGFYLGANFQSRSVPLPVPLPQSRMQPFRPQTTTPQGGMARLAQASKQGAQKGRAMERQRARQAGQKPEGPEGSNVIGPAAPSGGTPPGYRSLSMGPPGAAPTGAIMPGASLGPPNTQTQNLRTRSPAPGQMSFALGGTPATVAPVKKSRKQAFGQLPLDLGGGV